jgi:exodeoxyribonuclease V gamma subunit
VVSELLECAARRFRPKASSRERAVYEQSFIIEHPLQAFSLRYFNGSEPRLFSFSTENCAAGAARKVSEQPSPFISGPLPPGLPGGNGVPGRIELSDLTRFFANPAGYFLQSVLQIQLERVEKPLAESEPFSHSALEMHGLRQFLCAEQLAGGSFESSLEAARARGLLAPGSPARLQLAKLWSESLEVARRVKPLVQNPADPLPVHLELSSGWRIEGLLGGRYAEGGLVRWRAGEARCAEWMELWIYQLAFAAMDAACPPAVLVHTPSKKVLSNSVLAPDSSAEALDLLTTLVSLFERGQREPLRFFPRSAWAFATALAGGEEAASKKADAAWNGYGDTPGERQNEAISICFREDPDPLSAEFRELSGSILSPLLSRITEL